jgi:uncharacterized protein (DUF3084 family)
MAGKDEQITTFIADLAIKERDLATKDTQIQQLQGDVDTRDGQIQDMATRLQVIP